MTHIRVVVKGLGPGRLVSGRQALRHVHFLSERNGLGIESGEGKNPLLEFQDCLSFCLIF